MLTSQLRLGVNIDHIATLRQARGTRYPDPVYAAALAEEAGADGITLHLREDRRHIQERDVRLLKETLNTPMNLEMALTDEMINFALELQPNNVCIVPEKREELTTEGGLDAIAQITPLKKAIDQMRQKGIEVSLFIDPDEKQIDAALEVAAPVIEIHTGHYADALDESARASSLCRIIEAVQYANKHALIVNAGHGIHYHNVSKIAAIPTMNELNIGHSIIARSLMVGIKTAVSEMKSLMNQARQNAVISSISSAAI